MPKIKLQRILAIDPGPVNSGICIYFPADPKVRDKPKIVCGILQNEKILDYLLEKEYGSNYPYHHIVIEQVKSYGMPVGDSVFETCIWIGRFIQAVYAHPVILLPRQEVRLHLCKSNKANDATVRQALIDRFGAKGTKKNPGPLYGMKGYDEYSALALAVTYLDKLQDGKVCRLTDSDASTLSDDRQILRPSP